MARLVQTLLNAVSAEGAGEQFQIALEGPAGDEGVCQVKIDGVAEVKLQGRLHVDADWIDIKTFSSSEAVKVAVFPYVRGVVTNLSSGTVSMWLKAPREFTYQSN